ncbi:hypothetical protein HMPREF1862_00577 [Varibaculum cambriense]|uniref:DUF3846 domain-containing protein n=1 Tax=Varibaculum cambriense TaxID=184870 RepID=A0AB34X269_9ACTO|nr:hypothetical protein [Varibaculum cambriense]KXB81305.1 hypothetical protein HMPREF1862_00577 [Varibaculum cambriense]
MKRKMKKCYECCSAVADKNGKLLGSCIYIAFPEKIVEKKSEYLPFDPDELVSLAVEDGELVLKQLTDTPVKAVVTGFGCFPGSDPDEKLPMSKEEFLAPLSEGELSREPLFFSHVPVEEVRSAI